MNDNRAGKMRLDPRQTTLQFILFGLVGLLNTAVDIAVYWAMLQLSIYYVVANIIAYGAGMLNSYIWNSYLTFRSSGKANHTEKSGESDDGGHEEGARTRGRLLRFILWNCVTLLLSSALIVLFIELVHWSELWSKLLATFIIVVVQFAGMKKWVFRE